MNPPNNRDAEEAVVATLLVNEAAFPEVMGWLEPRHFFYERCRWIYEACMGVYGRGADVNTITVAHYLSTAGHLEKAGGQSYMASIIRSLPTSEGAEYYGKIVRECYIKRSLVSAGNAIMDLVARSRDGEDEIESLIAEASEILARVSSEAPDEGDTTGFYLRNGLAAEIIEWAENPGLITGLRTGFENLDRAMNGLCPGRLYVIMAAPKVGKSQMVYNWMHQIAYGEADHPHPIYLASTEMAGEEVTTRLIHLESSIEQMRVRLLGKMNSGEKARIHLAINALDNDIIHIRNRSSLPRIEADIRKAKLKYGVELAIVDHLQHLQVPRVDNPRERVDAAMRGLKTLALREDIPIVVVSHVGRSARSGGRLSWDAGAESSEIEKSADAIIIAEQVHHDGTGWVPVPADFTEDISSSMVEVDVRLALTRTGTRAKDEMTLDWGQGGRFRKTRRYERFYAPEGAEYEE